MQRRVQYRQLGVASAATHSRPRNRKEPKALSILVVEAHDAIREAIARSLARRGAHVTTATNGIEGLEAVRAERFDVVITDLTMPERGGLWLWEHALEVRPELRGRFVLISSEARPGQGMGLFLESEHFLVKPFSLEGLLDQAEEIGRRAGDRSGVLPQMSEQIEPGLQDDEQGEGDQG